MDEAGLDWRRWGWSMGKLGKRRGINTLSMDKDMNNLHREFARYRYSLEDSLNPFHGQGSETIKAQLPGLKARDLSRYILALEEITRLRPEWCAKLGWSGSCASRNELDVQAIAAFYRASNWMGNWIRRGWDWELLVWMNIVSQMPLEAFKAIVNNYIGNATDFNSNNLLPSLIAIFRMKVWFLMRQSESEL